MTEGYQRPRHIQLTNLSEDVNLGYHFSHDELHDQIAREPWFVANAQRKASVLLMDVEQALTAFRQSQKELEALMLKALSVLAASGPEKNASGTDVADRNCRKAVGLYQQVRKWQEVLSDGPYQCMIAGALALLPLDTPLYTKAMESRKRLQRALRTDLRRYESIIAARIRPSKCPKQIRVEGSVSNA